MGLRMHRTIVGDRSADVPNLVEESEFIQKPPLRYWGRQPQAPNSQLNKYGYEKIYRQNLANAAEAKESGCKILHLRRAAVSCCERWDEMICSAQAAP